MEVGEFWGLIEHAVRRHPARGERAGWLQAQLSLRPVDEILDFEAHLDDASDRAMSWLMWGAAYRILGGCSDDGFCYFRSWLMSLGRATFTRVVADPDALALVPAVRRLSGRQRRDWRAHEWPEWEELDFVASEAFEGVRGEGANIYRAVEQHRAHPRLDTLADEHWNFDDPAEMARRLPQLTTLFPLPQPRRGTPEPDVDTPAEIPGQLTIPGLPGDPDPGGPPPGSVPHPGMTAHESTSGMTP